MWDNTWRRCMKDCGIILGENVCGIIPGEGVCRIVG